MCELRTSTGYGEPTYELTFDELQHGARVAWRNAPKCANRKYWDSLTLLDHRSAQSNEQMFAACLSMLEHAMTSAVTIPYVCMFRQKKGKDDGPRIWNSQLLRFAAYREADGTILGDPANLKFTDMLIKKLKWVPPVPRTAWDLLPVVCQFDQDSPPTWFELPSNCAPTVKIRHPTHPAFDRLGLQWYPVPAVSNIQFEIGGLTFTAAPFSGWYAVTEIVRDIIDEVRYNKRLEIAAALGLDTSQHATCWVDEVCVETAKAVLFSFGEAGLGIVDHHTMLEGFWDWYLNELQERGFCPGNWKWIIPPMSSATSRCYLGLNKMLEYTLKPVLIPCPPWSSFNRHPKHFGTENASDMEEEDFYLEGKEDAVSVKTGVEDAFDVLPPSDSKIVHTSTGVNVVAEPTSRADPIRGGPAVRKKMLDDKSRLEATKLMHKVELWKVKALANRQRVCVVYATVTGTTKCVRALLVFSCVCHYNLRTCRVLLGVG
jgi:nitric-oxide synthase